VAFFVIAFAPNFSVMMHPQNKLNKRRLDDNAQVIIKED
jgi:hypothetical protein